MIHSRVLLGKHQQICKPLRCVGVKNHSPVTSNLHQHFSTCHYVVGEAQRLGKKSQPFGSKEITKVILSKGFQSQEHWNSCDFYENYRSLKFHSRPNESDHMALSSAIVFSQSSPRDCGECLGLEAVDLIEPPGCLNSL